MKRKVTKKVREQAWLICAIAASTPGSDGNWILTGDIAESIDASRDAEKLARIVRNNVRNTLWKSGLRWPKTDAEAAALLAEGWTPEGWV